MNFVDEEDDAPFFAGDVLQYAFEALFKLAAIFRPGKQRRHVQREHALVFQRLGHFAIDDARRQPFDDGGFAHAGFANQHRVVFRAPLQNLNRAADFVVAPDDRVELAGAGAFGQIQAIFFQRLALRFRPGVVDGRTAAHGIDGGGECCLLHAGVFEQTAMLLVVQHRQQKQFAGDEAITALLRGAVSHVQQFAQVAADGNFAFVMFQTRQVFQRGFQRVVERCRLRAGALQQCCRRTIRLCQQCRQHVRRFNGGVILPQRQTLRVRQGGLKGRGQFVHSHGENPRGEVVCPASKMGTERRESRALRACCCTATKFAPPPRFL